MNYVGNDSKIINKVREGDKKGLFERITRMESCRLYKDKVNKSRKLLFSKQMRRCKSLFGHKSEIFITPEDTFNNNTLKAMGPIGLRIKFWR